MKKKLILTAAAAVAWLAFGQKPEESTTVLLCDNETKIILPGVKPGERLDPQRAMQVAELFMDTWKIKNPGSNWIMATNYGPRLPLAAQVQASDVQSAGKGPKQAEIYSRFGPRDEFLWKTEFDKFVQEGNRIFHDAEAFGGTVGVSCDMCHPNAANTHPETYPKYQVQIQKVALLRDMINWCIQHPTKGKPLADDDPRMRAMEAYIMAQRKGKAMEPNKH